MPLCLTITISIQTIGLGFEFTRPANLEKLEWIHKVLNGVGRGGSGALGVKVINGGTALSYKVHSTLLHYFAVIQL